MKKKNKQSEFLIGMMLGLVLAILFFTKLTFAAEVSEPQRCNVYGSVAINSISDVLAVSNFIDSGKESQ